MSTHNLGQARRLADDVVFLHRGARWSSTRPRDAVSSSRRATAEAAAFLEGELPW